MITDEELMDGDTVVEEAIEGAFLEKNDAEEEKPLKVHLDKWLWAARFYKTLPLARKAIQSGKIYYNGHRSRSSVEISVGGLLKIQHGNMDKLVIILGLSTRRRSMKDAAALYQDISQHQDTLSRGGIAENAPQSRYTSNSQGYSQGGGYARHNPEHRHGFNPEHRQGFNPEHRHNPEHQGQHQHGGYRQSHHAGDYQHNQGYAHGHSQSGQSGQFRSPYQRQSYLASSSYEDREKEHYPARTPSLLDEQQREKPKRIIRFLRRPLQKPATAPLAKAEPETVDAE